MTIVTASRSRTGAGELLAWLVFAALSFLAAKYLLFDAFYIYRIHSDSSFHFILGKTILETGELFPRDFWYGNDLILLRPQFMIALFQAAGLRGWECYSLACSALIAIFVPVTGIAARHLLPLSLPGAMFVALAAFIPTGATDWDFVLAQQSHLQTVSLSLIGAFALFAAVRDRRWLLLAMVLVVLMGWDSTPRAAILLFGYGAIVWLCFRTDRGLRRFAVSGLVLALGVAAVIRILTPIELAGVYGQLGIQLGNSPARLVQFVSDFLVVYLGQNEVSPPGNPAALAIWIAKLALAAALVVSGVANVWRAWRAVRAAAPVPPAAALTVAGLVIVAAGTAIVSITYLDLNVRHVVVGLAFVKVGLVLWLFESARAAALRAGVAVALIGASSTLAATLAVPNFRSPHLLPPPDVAAMSGVLDRHFPDGAILYGTFWNSLVYEVFLDGRIATASIRVDRGKLVTHRWLTRRSRYCGTGDVLVVTDETEADVAALVEADGGVLLERQGGLTFYRAPGNILADCPL